MRKKLVLSLVSIVSLGMINFSSADDTGIITSIQNFTVNIGNYFSMLIQRLTNFFNSIIDVIGYIISILKAIRFGLVSLLSGIWELIVEVFNGDVFVRVNSAFIDLGDYIGGPAVVFLATLLFLIIFRIGVAFVFKILRLNVDYHALQKNTEKWNIEDDKKKSAYH